MSLFRRFLSTSPALRHEIPKPTGPDFGLKRTPFRRRGIPHVTKVLAVASGKGGVGKSTVAVNLAFALAMQGERRLRVGILDLDILGPSVPILMGTEGFQPSVTSAGALIPITNHGMPTMSMSYLLPPSPDKVVAWRGLMVQKTVQQLLFDVDWRASEGGDEGPGVDVLVVDMPPGTGDVPITLGQLVNVDGAVIVSTPQDVALSDVRKGISVFRKVGVPITGILLNQSHFTCPSCSTPHSLFGPPDGFRQTAREMGLEILGELPLITGLSVSGDHGVPYALVQEKTGSGKEWGETMVDVAGKVVKALYVV